jgi:hypothetical protein|tara:strand:- start:28 stop:741 length:714 start_codon:yes stop_codon:yes gene_type:complete
MRKTKLTWPDYKQAALKLKSQGLGYPKIYEKLGLPIWDGVEYKLESDRGNIKRKTREASRAGKASSTKTRTTNQAISTPEGTDTRATNRLVKQINAAGGQADHKAELSRTGNAMRDMTPPRRQLMQQRMGPEIGHQTGNIQHLSAADNLQKNVDYRRLDSHLRRLGKQAVVGKPMFGSAAGVLLGFLPEIDEITGGHINNGINGAMNGVKNQVQKSAEFYTNLWADRQAKGYDLHIF